MSRIDASPGAKGGILCVEDDPISRDYLGKMLRLLFPDQRVLCAENGRAGLALFHEATPSVVVTDISMPIMDGVEMARRIREFAPSTRIIALTAHSGLQEYPDDPSQLFDHLILKPVNRHELRQAIDSCLAGLAPG